MEEKISLRRYQQAKEELRKLLTEERPEIAEQLKKARALGDLCNNLEYAKAVERLRLTEERIGYLYSILDSMEVIEGLPPDENKSTHS